MSGKTPIQEQEPSVQTPNAVIKQSEKDYHIVLKRLRESPDNGVNVLKTFCMHFTAVTSKDDFQETDPTFSDQNKQKYKKKTNQLRITIMYYNITLFDC